jgi:hypothetical protein
MLEDNKIYVSYIGGDFKEPFTFWFYLTKETLDEMWQYSFQEDYDEEVNKELDLNWVEDVSTIAYTMLHDLKYEPQNMGNET